MKYGVRPGIWALFFVTLFAAAFVAPSDVMATNHGHGHPTGGSNQPATPSEQPALLYRVRYGAPWRGEIEQRYFIERNIALAAEKGIAVGDHDPDGDGWAIVGHTDTDYDGKKIGGFSINFKKVPSIMLFWDNDTRCALLTPISLDVVKPDEDRLLKATIQRMCFAPSTDVNVVILPPPLEMPTQASDEPIQAIPVPMPSPEPQEAQGSPQQQAEVVHVQQMEDVQLLDLIAQVPVPGVVEAASTNAPNYIDNPGKNTTEPVQEIGNSIMIAISVTVAVILGIVVLVHTSGIMQAWK